MSDLTVHFSSKTDEWETPWDFFEEFNKEFNFTVDVCATVQNTKCDQWFDKKMDGLKQSWPSCACWMNPPYGREISKWIKKAYESSLNGSIVVCCHQEQIQNGGMITV